MLLTALASRYILDKEEESNEKQCFCLGWGMTGHLRF